MKNQVTVTDNTLRFNVVQHLTFEMRQDALSRGVHIPPEVKFIPVRDEHGKQVQREAHRDHTYKGAALTHAVKRARRWLRSGKRTSNQAPHHIALALLAFKKAEPKVFNACLKASLV